MIYFLTITNEITKTTSNSENTISITLIILITANIVIEIIKFFSKLALSNKNVKNSKKILIDEKRINIVEKLYKDLEKLSLYDKNNNQELLNDITKINQYITNNKLYISKKFQKISNNILDYFRIVLTDYRQKSIEKETELYDKFCNEFIK